MAGQRNGFAALVDQRSAGESKRRPLDDYETPPEATRTLVDHVSFEGPIWEPAAGSGRLANVLRDEGYDDIDTTDIKNGDDFLSFELPYPGNIITNPPYRDGLNDAFVQKALQLADGRVAMLMEARYLWGGKRAKNLYHVVPPELVIVLPNRVYFYTDGEPITSQFFNHCWIVWPAREFRDELVQYETRIEWAA